MGRGAAGLLRQVLRASVDNSLGEWSDRDLLQCFAEHQDQTAFAALFRRHAALVLGVCRRALPNVQDAEDACQATFLLLAQKANSVRWQPSVANWLYTTARRVAHNARITAERRARREAHAAVPEAVQPVDLMTGRELLALVDEELDRLPSRYREPLLLCYLQGLTRDEAAQRLGVPPTTLKSHLERGRKRLGHALTKRGCALGVGLLVLAATSPAGVSSPCLAEAVLAAAAGSPSAAVAALAKGVAVNGMGKIVTFGLVALVGVALASIALAYGRPPAVRPPDEKAGEAKAEKIEPGSKAPDGKEQRQIVVGRVLDPEGRPLAGARLYTPKLKKNPPEKLEDLEVVRIATTGSDGGFRVTLDRPGDMFRQYLIAHADGFGVDWLELDRNGTPPDGVVLRLVRDLPITGKVVNTEGKPLAGVSVHFRGVLVPEREKLDDYLTGWKRSWRDTVSSPKKRLYVPGEMLFGKTITGRDGTFRLTGAGVERIVNLSVEGGGVAQTTVIVLTRKGIDPKPSNEAAAVGIPPELRLRGQPPILYGPEPTIVVETGKVIEGVVKDLTTGKLLPGVRVGALTGFGDGVMGVTDKDGKYRLAGLPLEKSYRVYASPPAGSPYIRRGGEAEALPGSATVRIDIGLAKGVVVKGRVIDRQTGKGVQAGIRFAPLPDNKYFGKPGFDGYKTDHTMEETDRQGRFRVVTIPGRSLIMAQVYYMESTPDFQVKPYRTARPDPDYKDLFHHDKDDDSWRFTAANGGLEFLSNENVVKVVDLKEDGGEFAIDLYAERGSTAKLLIQDAAGKPIPGVVVSGLAASWPYTHQLKNVEKPVTVYALDPERPRRLVLLHPQKKLGGTVTLRGDEKEPVVVKLGPLGSIKGRFLEVEGAPLAGVEVTVSSSDGIASELHRFLARTSTPARTDKEGRFTVSDVVPGVKVYLQTRRGNTYYVGEPRVGQRQLEPGQTLDLGDWKMRPQR
jgi:RNA polymerase sigma factor (sigma-70 family)